MNDLTTQNPTRISVEDAKAIQRMVDGHVTALNNAIANAVGSGLEVELEVVELRRLGATKGVPGITAFCSVSPHLLT